MEDNFFAFNNNESDEEYDSFYMREKSGIGTRMSSKLAQNSSVKQIEEKKAEEVLDAIFNFGKPARPTIARRPLSGVNNNRKQGLIADTCLNISRGSRVANIVSPNNESGLFATS